MTFMLDSYNVVIAWKIKDYHKGKVGQVNIIEGGIC